MSQQNDTEQKNLPPSERKLKKAREKGQVSGSQDFVSIFTTLVVLAVIAFTWQEHVRLLDAMLIRSEGVIRNPTGYESSALFLEVVDQLADLLLILAPIIIISIAITNIIHKKGIPISIHPITPDFNRINPASGLKKMFSIRNATEFAVSMVRSFAWFGAAALVVWITSSDVLMSAICGPGCVLTASVALTLRVVILAVIFLIIIALMDLPLQSALFNHEMRMGHKELKREQKDTLGSPEFRRYRRDEAKRVIDSAVATSGGLEDAAIVMAGGPFAVVLRYDSNEFPVPVVSARGRDGNARAILQAADTLNVAIHTDGVLARALFENIQLGDEIRPEFFDAVAMALVAARNRIS